VLNDFKLRVFITAVDSGSFTAAASVLDMSQPAVSKQIKNLEAHLGEKLFRRNGRGTAVTSTGLELYKKLVPAFTDIDKTVTQLVQNADTVAGHLSIAVVHTLNSYLTVPVIQKISTKYPQLQLQMYERSSLQVSQLVASGKVDIGLAYDSMVVDPELTMTSLHAEKMQLYCRSELLNQSVQENTVAISSQLPMVSMTKGFALGRMLERQLKGHLQVFIQVETVDLMLEIVRTGMAACILPANMPARLIERTGLQRYKISNFSLSRNVVAICRQQREQDKTIAFVLGQFKHYSNNI